MSIWYHYIVTEGRPITLEEIGAALQQTNRKFYVDADLIVKKPTADAEPDYDEDSADLICGQVTFEDFDNGLQEDYEPIFYEWAEEREGHEKVINLFRGAKSIVTVQVINGGGDSDVYEESIAPLWDWLRNNRPGILVAEGGDFYDKSGIIK